MQRLTQYCAFILLALLSTQAGAQAAAAPVKIGYVNIVRIESESTIAKQSAEVLKKEFAPREAQLLEMQKQGNDLQADLEKNSATMPAADRAAKEKRFAAMAQQYQQMQRSLFEEVEARKRETFGGFVTEINAAIKTVAEAGKYDRIVHQAVYNAPQFVITPQGSKEIPKGTAGQEAPSAKVPVPRGQMCIHIMTGIKLPAGSLERRHDDPNSKGDLAAHSARADSGTMRKRPTCRRCAWRFPS